MEEDIKWPLTLGEPLRRTNVHAIGKARGAKIRNEDEVPVEAALEITLDEADVEKTFYKLYEAEHRETGKTLFRYMEVDFVAVPKTVGQRVYYQFKIHQSGTWPGGLNKGNLDYMGEDVLIEEIRVKRIQKHEEAGPQGK